MKKLDVKSIRVPDEFALRGVFGKSEIIDKWTTENVYEKTKTDDITALRIGNKPREMRVFISVLNDESFLFFCSSGKVAVLRRKDNFARDLHWNIYNAMQSSLYNDVVVAIVKKLILLHNEEIAPIEAKKNTEDILGEIASVYEKAKEDRKQEENKKLFSKKKGKKKSSKKARQVQKQ